MFWRILYFSVIKFHVFTSKAAWHVCPESGLKIHHDFKTNVKGFHNSTYRVKDKKNICTTIRKFKIMNNNNSNEKGHIFFRRILERLQFKLKLSSPSLRKNNNRQRRGQKYAGASRRARESGKKIYMCTGLSSLSRHLAAYIFLVIPGRRSPNDPDKPALIEKKRKRKNENHMQTHNAPPGCRERFNY